VCAAERSEKNRLDLTFFILQREVNMTGLGAPQIGNFSLHQNKIERFFEEKFNVIIQL
jgi:hypothetical protein